MPHLRGDEPQRGSLYQPRVATLRRLAPLPWVIRPQTSATLKAVASSTKLFWNRFAAGGPVECARVNAQDMVLAAVFLALAGWFLIRNRQRLKGATFARHVIFMVLVWAGCMAFLHGGAVVRLVFSREIYKGEPKETAAVAVRIGTCLFFFAGAALALGKDRVRQFKLYGEAFGVKKPRPPK